MKFKHQAKARGEQPGIPASSIMFSVNQVTEHTSNLL